MTWRTHTCRPTPRTARHSSLSGRLANAQVLSTGSTGKAGGTVPGEQPAAPEPEIRHVSLAEARNGRPRTLSGVSKKIQTGHGPLYVTMNDDEFGPRECFVVLGKPGGTAAAFSPTLWGV